MSQNINNEARSTGGRRVRKRLRGAFSGRKGKAIGIASIATPIVGFVVNDLKKPNSIIRALIGKTATKLLERKAEKTQVIDITDQVEIVEDQRKG